MTKQEQTAASPNEPWWHVGYGSYIVVDWWLEKADGGENLNISREYAAAYINGLETSLVKAEATTQAFKDSLKRVLDGRYKSEEELLQRAERAEALAALADEVRTFVPKMHSIQCETRYLLSWRLLSRRCVCWVREWLVRYNAAKAETEAQE